MKNIYMTTMAVFLLLVCKTNLSAQTLPVINNNNNLQLWLDASDVNFGTANPADGTNLTTWVDKSGKNHSATVYPGTNYTPAKVYSNSINGKSVVRFTRASQLAGNVYQTANLDIRATASAAITIFTVYKQGTQTGDQAVWGNDNGGWDRFFFTSWSSVGSANNGGVSIGNGAQNVAGSGVVGSTQLLTAVYNTGVTNGSAIYFNGQPVTTFTDGTDPVAAYNTFRIGFDGDDNCFNGDVAEILVYNALLSPCDIQQVNRYLGAKYGVTFSTAAISNTTTSFPEGGSITLNATPAGAAGYQWLKDGTAIAGATSNSYSTTTPGNYQVAVTNSCVDTSASVPVTATTMVTPGNALAFDGVDDYVDCRDLPAFIPANMKTIECWVKFNSFSTDQEIISKSVISNGMEMLVYGGNLSLYLMNGGNTSYISYPTSNLSTGVWYHLAATWNGSTKESIKLYVNGAPVGNLTHIGDITSAGVNNPAVSLKIGNWSASSPTRPLNGAVDEVRIWSVERSQTQIQASMYNIVSATNGLQAYYKFDLGTAGAANAATATLYDVSGNYRPGTLTNFALTTGSTSNWVESYGMVVPVATAASSIGSSGFTANWTAPVAGTVSNYLLYVSTSPTFATTLTGYNGRNVGAVTSFNVTGTAPTTTYYYRVRADKTSVTGQGAIPSTYTTLTTLATLPVTLAGFTAKQQGSGVQLQWSTSSELNTARFVVERSFNGIDFTRIASVNAAGTSSSARRYETGDNAPQRGTNFYRLKQEDIDGNYTYSPVRQVVFVDGKASTVLYPSPATDHFTIDSNDPTLSGSTGIMTDIQGKVVKKFVISGTKQQVNINTLTRGVYQVQLANKMTFRVVKE